MKQVRLRYGLVIKKLMRGYMEHLSIIFLIVYVIFLTIKKKPKNK